MSNLYSRRHLLATVVSAFTVTTIGSLLGRQALATPIPGQPSDVWIVNFAPSGARLDRVKVHKVIKTDQEWHRQLSGSAYQVTRHEGTELPYSGKYVELHARGLFRCICCDTALFDSKTKYDSGTGWPSFYQPIAEDNINKITDSTLGMTRTAISCARCDAHLGHVFSDGPQPTGLRYCMNSVALNFVPSV